MIRINRSFFIGVGVILVTWIVAIFTHYNIEQMKKMLPLYELNATMNATYHRLFASEKQLNADKQSNNFFSNYLTEQIRPDLLPIIKTSQNITNKLEQDLFDLGLVHNEEEQQIRDEGYKTHAYNVLISNKLSYHREIPDSRNTLCRNISYPKNLPDASIVICFYNEHYQTLLRTLYSIIDRTPTKLLHEIVLIDDFSDIKDLHENIQFYLKQYGLNKVKFYKTERREGLIRARLFGARKAKGKVLIFLDSHIEVNVGWIEPLLNRIKSKRTNVVMPIIDIINPDTFAYSSSPLVRGGFNWGLHFKWDNLPKGTLDKPEDFIKPIKSPTMAGGLFAINRKYFIDVGEYDAGMNIWGGENLEISFRIWMCGGSLELIPCSRVGHIFRHRRPYGAPDGEDTMLHNSLRVAHVWMDDYKDFYLAQNNQAENVDFGDISSRLQLRKELKCHDFDWYLKNIYPELALPSDDEARLQKKWSAVEQDKYQPWHSRKRNYIAQFLIRLDNSSLCIQSAKDIKTKGSLLVLRPCLKSKEQIWYQTDRNELVLAQLLCLQASKPNPILYKCHELGADQEWKHKAGKNSPIYNLGAGTCLGVAKKKVNATIAMKLCTDPELNTWDLISQ